MGMICINVGVSEGISIGSWFTDILSHKDLFCCSIYFTSLSSANSKAKFKGS